MGSLRYDPERLAIGPLANTVSLCGRGRAENQRERIRWAYLHDRPAAELPVLWERANPGNHVPVHDGVGQNVLFMDGHVELWQPEQDGDRFPVSPFSRRWLAVQVPAPSGNPADPWGDCP